MAADEKWYFTKEQLANTPSRKCGVDPDKELSYRQQAANLIQNMGQRLLVSQLCINTAIVYMHRFYMFHSLTQFHRNEVAIAALFLAAKVEEQPRKLDHVIKMGHTCLHREGQNLDLKSDIFIDQAQCLVYNENVLLLTLGFDVAIDHPHTHVVRCCHLVKASKDLAQTSYFMASNSLHLTTMCLQYKPTVVACFCIHLACKWSNMEIPQSNEGKPWFWYVDKTVTSELLAQLTGEFLHIFDKYPSRLKRKVRSISANQSPNLSHPPIANSPFDVEPRRIQSQSTSNANAIKSPTPNSNANVSTNANTNVDGIGSQSNRPSNDIDNNKKSSSAMPSRTAVDYRDYREKKERERQDRERAGANTSSVSIDTNKHHSHHQKQSSSSTSAQPNKHSSSSSNSSNKSVHHNHHHSSRQDVKSQMMPQRHSTSSQQPRDPNRDRQRISHGHSVDNSSMNNIVQETVHPPEKLSNSIHKSSHNSKPYARYSDAQSRSRKQDILEQRSEEVRKLIEKPLPIKPRAEVLKEEYAAKMLKQSHHPSKYEVAPEKSICSVNATQPTLPYVDNAKMLNVGQTAFTVAKSPNAPVSASQGSQKSLSSMKSSGQMPVKNGSSTSVTSSFSLVSSFDDLIPEKKPEHPPPPPTNKHRSLFSPEKTPTNARELSHMQRPVKKGRISPIKDVHSSYPSSNQMQTSAESLQQQGSKQKLSNSASTVPTGHKQRNHSDLVSNQLQPFKQQTQIEDSSRRYSMPTIAMHDSTPLGNNRIPELIQPIKDSPVGNKNISTPITDVKPQSQHHGLSNGLEQNIMKHEYSTIDPSSFLIKNELPEQLLSNEITTDFMFVKQDQQKLGDFLTFHEPVFETTEESVRKQESISPLKSAQGISALLQEPLAMPSLLQPPANFVQHLEDNKMLQQQHGSTEVDNILPSTVDMSDLTGPIQCTVDVPARPVTPVAALPPTPSPTPIPVASAPLNSTNAVNASEEKKSEHRSKSEKKKEKKKHKHKEKEKEKEKKDKHKHKHKDKDKEKHHRDKGDKEKKTEEDNSASVGGSASALGTVPIKITIPKDKLNLSADSIGTSSSTTSSSSLKIKIPKERLKGTEVTSHQLLSKSQQPVRPAPLKIKIRTDALARSSSDMQAPSQQESNNGASSSKKRERSDPTEGTPASKKLQQQRPNERHNGRHNPYSSYADKPDRFYEAVEVKTESGDAGEGLPRNYLPNNYDSSIYS